MSDDDLRDWFGQGGPASGSDPMASARRGAKPALPKRFYKAAGWAEGEGGYVLTLDGRPARTPARSPLALPTRPLAEAVAAEWEAQAETIDPSAMPLTRLANSAIDGVAPRREAVLDDLAAYAGTDLVVYRAASPESLVAAQAAAWDPVLDWAREELGARFILGEGVMHVAQDEDSVEAVRAALRATEGAFHLAALHAMTTLAGSVLIALATARGRLAPDEGWLAANVDEDFQARVWGYDAEAAARRAAREAEFLAAGRMHALA